MTRVFISYSHDSDAHRDFVRGLSDRLRADGLDCQINQYYRNNKLVPMVSEDGNMGDVLLPLKWIGGRLVHYGN